MQKIILLIVCVMVLLSGCSQKSVKPVHTIENTNIQLPEMATEALKLAHLLRDNGRYKAAFDVYKNMDEKKELNRAYLLEYATVGSLVIQPSQVITLYKRAEKEFAGHETNEEREALCVGLGRAYLKVAQRDKAEYYLDCALQVNPNNVTALNGAGVIRSYRGEVDKAKTMLTKALEIQPDNMMVLNNLAMTYLSSGNYSKAIDLLITQENILPMSGRLNLALAYILNERTDMARELLNRYTDSNRTEDIINRFELICQRIKNGSSVNSELTVLTHNPLTLVGDKS
ncbi:tetratricopeptide repeat protein [Vibrio salinus]|uniref:tetratricopeptide repeat protein n=1 Tax=Vibrio salinus TaxID=2899784 RepID=UPI001E61B70F|nr:tetratricopeptide repeat protein [Vibrio salinus]MCE0495908.1 tetratricopeptide repeat protein [Vibrio salinus]